MLQTCSKMSFERLRRIEKPTFKKGSAKNLEEFYEILIKNQFKHSDIIKKIHNSILQYIETPNPTFLCKTLVQFPLGPIFCNLYKKDV